MNKSTFAVFTACAVAGLANAATVDVACTGVGPYQNINTLLAGNPGNEITGQIYLALTNSVGCNLNGNWISFCTEINQNIQIGGSPQTYQVMSVADLPTPGAGMGAARADAIARMYFAAAGAQYGGDANFSAAFQLAIWEVSNDYDGTAGSLNLGANVFQVTDVLNAPTAADVAFLFAAAANVDGQKAHIIGLGSETYQDQIIECPIPAPGAIALMGLAGLISGRRRA